MGWKIDWSLIEPLFMGDVSDKQRGGIESILAICDEYNFTDKRWVAYILATSYHETARTMRAVKEAYWLSETWRKNNLSYYPYYGRGHVQLTHRDNYKKAGDFFGVNLVDSPDKALEPEISAHVIAIGMRDGWFRADGSGKRHALNRYFSSSVDDPVGARKIVNGKEKKVVAGVATTVAAIMADYHAVFLTSLSTAGLELAMFGAAAAKTASNGMEEILHASATSPMPKISKSAENWGMPSFENEVIQGEPNLETNAFYPYEKSQVQFAVQLTSSAVPPLSVQAVLGDTENSQRYSNLLSAASGLSLTGAMERLITIKESNYVDSNPRYWAIFNLSVHSRNKRLHIFDAMEGTFTSHLCAHGKGSDTNHDGIAERFSNVDGSHMTSLGVYRCAETYYGENGFSLRMDGLEATNSNARDRAVVIHGASYVSDEFVAAIGKVGRSWGCPAVPHANRNSVISLLRGGSFLIAWKG